MRLDNRLLLILLISLIYVYGGLVLNWGFDFSKLSAIFLFGMLTQALFCLAFKIPINASISSIITTMLLGLLVRTEFIFICGMVSFFAVSSKYIFQFRGKSLFNPANFGLVFMMFFTHQIFVTSHHTDYMLIGLTIIGVLVVLYRSDAKKMDVLFFYLVLNYIISIVYNICGYDVIAFHWNELWFLLYVSVLIVDPLTNPNSRIGRLIWTFSIVLISHILNYNLKVPNSHLYALIIGGFITPILDLVYKTETRFSWDSVYRRTLYTNESVLTESKL